MTATIRSRSVITSGALLLAALIVFSIPAGRVDAQQAATLQVGGPFSLIDHRGQAVTEQDFAGKLLLVQFGFTYCPDICPTELQELSVVMDALDEEGARVAPLFITVDPARDRPDVLADYLSHFHPGITGLSGSPAQIDAVARAYQVYYAKNGEGDDYLIDHSAVTYLMGPDGRYITHFSRRATAEEIIGTLRDHLAGTAN